METCAEDLQKSSTASCSHTGEQTTTARETAEDAVFLHSLGGVGALVQNAAQETAASSSKPELSPKYTQTFNRSAYVLVAGDCFNLAYTSPLVPDKRPDELESSPSGPVTEFRRPPLPPVPVTPDRRPALVELPVTLELQDATGQRKSSRADVWRRTGGRLRRRRD